MTLALMLRRAALVATAVASPFAAQAETTIKPGRPIDVGLSASSAVRNVTSLNNGGALFAVADGQDILVRPVDAKGRAKPAVSLTTNGRSEFGIEEAKLTKLTNGNVAAAWIGRPSGQDAVLIRVVRPDGTAASSEVVVTELSAGNSQDNVSAAALSGGKFVVAWADYQEPNLRSLRARVFAANGQAQGAPAVLTAPAGVILAAPRVAPLGDGFVMTYVTYGDREGVFAQLFTGAAKAIGAPIRLDRRNELTHENARVRKLDSGGAAVVWQENQYSEAGSLPIVVDTTLKGVFIDENGKRGKAIALNDPISARSKESGVSLSETEAGLLVAWSVLASSDKDVLNRDVRGAVVSFSGKAGKVFVLAKNRDRENGPHFARVKNGRTIMGYSATAGADASGPLGAFGAFLKISD